MEIEIAALLISVVASGIALFSLSEAKKANRLSTSPYLNGNEVYRPGEYSFHVINKGNGIALFKEVKYYLEEKEVTIEKLEDHINKTFYAKGVRGASITKNKIGNKVVMSASEKLLIGKVSFLPETEENFKSALETMNTGVLIKYSSQYGEEKTFYSNDELELFLIKQNSNKNYKAILSSIRKWWAVGDSNARPMD